MAASYLSGELPQGRIGVGYARAAELLKTVPPAPSVTLTLAEVDSALGQVASMRGAGSARRRVARLTELFARATVDEQQLLYRLLVGELRQGALEGLLVEAIAQATGLPPSEVRRAVMVRGAVPPVARAALHEGSAGVARFRTQLFRPLQPMLAMSAAGAEEALALIAQPALEYKLDGARVQVHRVGDDVRVFSRQLNDVTVALPEVVEAVRALPLRQAILDGEAIALRSDGHPQPFQTTMRRFGRKLDVQALRLELPLDVFFFDLLHLNGQDLLEQPAAVRLEALDEVLRGKCAVRRQVANSAVQVSTFLQEALAAGHEGLMAKSLEAPYEAGRRGAAWLKIKPSQTLDLVVLAAEWGSGRRKGWLSNLHLGARDPTNNTYVMLGKTFKGMTDAVLEWQTRRLQEIAIGRERHVVHVRPELVVEIAFDGLQASPQYPGGLALRFARVRRYREDKRAEDADTIETVRALRGATPQTG